MEESQKYKVRYTFGISVLKLAFAELYAVVHACMDVPMYICPLQYAHAP